MVQTDFVSVQCERSEAKRKSSSEQSRGIFPSTSFLLFVTFILFSSLFLSIFSVLIFYIARPTTSFYFHIVKLQRRTAHRRYKRVSGSHFFRIKSKTSEDALNREYPKCNPAGKLVFFQQRKKKEKL